MKKCEFILLLFCLSCVVGCSTMFQDPIEAAYKSGQISKEEYLHQTQLKEEELARTSPAYWELQQAEDSARYDLNASK